MKRLEECNWKAFALKDVFDEIQRGKRLKTDDHIAGSMPYVSSSSIDNGVDNFIGNKDGVRVFEDCITLANSGSVGMAFYQPFKFVASDHVTKLKLSFSNKYIYLFLANQVSKLAEKYSFNREINDARINREYIVLPVNSEDKPDYAFMEEYMREVEKRQKENYKAYIQERINELENVEKLEDKEWKPFKLIKLFDPNKGNQTDMNSLQDGDVPLVSARKVNNGLRSFVETQNLYQGHCVTLNNDGDGGAGLAYYQPFDFALDSHVTALYPKQEMSKHIQVFLSRCISMQEEFFGHGHSINSNRLNSFTIMLPINSDGEPDYVFMESYMKRKEMEMLKRYVERMGK